jgi:hypothetical protein
MPTDSSPSYAEGGCLCGAVRYRVTGSPVSSSVCHCRSCRLAAGSPAVAWIAYREDHVRFLQGHPASRHSSPKVVRTFCPRCGTPLTYRHTDEPDVLELTTATLDHPELYPPTLEIWVEHRIAWEAIEPKRVQHLHGSGEPPIERAR